MVIVETKMTKEDNITIKVQDIGKWQNLISAGPISASDVSTTHLTTSLEQRKDLLADLGWHAISGRGGAWSI